MTDVFVIDGPGGRTAAITAVATLPAQGRYEVTVARAANDGPTPKQMNTFGLWARVAGNDVGNTPREIKSLWALEYGLETPVQALAPQEMSAYLEWIQAWCADVGYELPNGGQ